MPYPLVILSGHKSAYPFEYTVSWEKPKTGGLPIREYEFKFRRVCDFSYCVSTRMCVCVIVWIVKLLEI